MGKSKMPLARAQQLAKAIVAELSPGCSRIAVAGSVRRECLEVGDLEIVAIPAPATNLLGEPDGDYLRPILDGLEERGRLELLKGGDRYRQYRVVKANAILDLFLTSADRWGCVFLIRTGSAQFSQQAVSKCIPRGFRFEGGRLFRNGDLIDTPEEADVFKALGIKWVEPRDRR